MKRIAIIGTVGLPPKYGGFETFANQLIIHLAEKFQFTVFCSRFFYKNKERHYLGVRRIFLPFRPNGWQSIFYDFFSIIYSLFRADTLLILGVSGCIVLPIIKPFHRKKIIVSIDGLDAERSKWSKMASIFIRASEKCAVKFADIIISDNRKIEKYINNKYKVDSIVIEYGGDQSKKLDFSLNDNIKYPFIHNEYALAIARIEKENHTELILKTFANQDFGIKLVYVGTWNHNKYGRNLYKKYNSYKNIILINPIYDIYDINLIRSNCEFFIHGNGVGGTNPGLLEAMHVELPIIAYDIDFNRNVTENNAQFFKTEDQLAEQIKIYLSDKKIKNKNSKNVLQIAKDKYMWKDIVEQYAKIF